MGVEQDIALFERVPSLATLGQEALRILAIGGETLALDEGAVLFRHGELADGGYVVRTGEFQLTEHATGAAPVAVGPGAMLGELAMLVGSRRAFTAVAVAPSSVINIPRKLFLRMLEEYPDEALRLRNFIAARTQEAMRDVLIVRESLNPPGAGATRRR